LNYLRYFCLAGLLTGLFPTSLFAADNWGLCHIPAYYFVGESVDNSVTEVEANHLIREENTLLTFSGDVELRRGDQSIQAEVMIFDENTEQLEARGAVVLEKPDFRLTSEQMDFNLANDTAIIDAPEFELRDSHARGSADKIEILDESRSHFSHLLYTACDPGDRDWHFTSSSLEINDESGLGSAWNTTLYFQNIPFFYLPYFRFPIDDRRMSGVLTPTFSFSNSDNSHLAVPVYWNIAPNFDTTFVPAQYAERGLLYNSEHRYLFRHQRGQLDYSRIEDDITSETRWFKKWKHKASYADNSLTGNLLLQEVSDKDFIGDFSRLVPGNDEVDHLDRHLQIGYSSTNWTTGLLWQNYQTVDESIAIANRPYQRLPQLTLNSQFPRLDNGLQFSLENELVYFKRVATINGIREESINGNRAHIVPSVSWLSSDSWYFFEPQLQYPYTEYELEDNTLGDNAIQRSLPVASIDSGLIFERSMGPSNNWLQTLEPRLYFVHIPFEEQSDIPDFDTSLNPDSYANFFIADRFRGADRIGDTDQVTFGLGSHIYNTEGRQLLYARMAQVFYAEDREVVLSGLPDEREKSNIVAQLDINPSPFLRISTGIVYDEELEETTERTYSINWAKGDFAANTEFYIDEATQQQTSYSFAYAINDSWAIVAKQEDTELFNKPVENSFGVNNLFGISYESCCWGLKILASEVSDEEFIEVEEAIFFELTLKGLTQAGQNVDSYLKTEIPGYKPQF